MEVAVKNKPRRCIHRKSRSWVRVDALGAAWSWSVTSAPQSLIIATLRTPQWRNYGGDWGPCHPIQILGPPLPPPHLSFDCAPFIAMPPPLQMNVWPPPLAPQNKETPICRTASRWFAPACRRPIALWWCYSIIFGIVMSTSVEKLGHDDIWRCCLLYPYVTMLQRANCDNIWLHLSRAACDLPYIYIYIKNEWMNK